MVLQPGMFPDPNPTAQTHVKGPDNLPQLMELWTGYISKQEASAHNKKPVRFYSFDLRHAAEKKAAPIAGATEVTLPAAALDALHSGRDRSTGGDAPAPFYHGQHAWIHEGFMMAKYDGYKVRQPRNQIDCMPQAEVVRATVMADSPCGCMDCDAHRRASDCVPNQRDDMQVESTWSIIRFSLVMIVFHSPSFNLPSRRDTLSWTVLSVSCPCRPFEISSSHARGDSRQSDRFPSVCSGPALWTTTSTRHSRPAAQ